MEGKIWITRNEEIGRTFHLATSDIMKGYCQWTEMDKLCLMLTLGLESYFLNPKVKSFLPSLWCFLS